MSKGSAFDILNEDSVDAVFQFLPTTLSLLLVSWRFHNIALNRSWLPQRLHAGILHAAKHGYTEYFDRAVQCAPKKRKWKMSPDVLLAACSSGSLEIVKIIHSRCLLPLSVKRNMALRNAASEQHVEVVKFLLSQKSVDPNSGNLEAWQRALHNPELRDLFLECPRFDRAHALGIALQSGVSDVAMRLLAENVGKVKFSNAYSSLVGEFYRALRTGILELARTIQKRTDLVFPDPNGYIGPSLWGCMDSACVTLALEEPRMHDQLFQELYDSRVSSGDVEGVRLILNFPLRKFSTLNLVNCLHDVLLFVPFGDPYMEPEERLPDYLGTVMTVLADERADLSWLDYIIPRTITALDGLEGIEKIKSLIESRGPLVVPDLLEKWKVAHQELESLVLSKDVDAVNARLDAGLESPDWYWCLSAIYLRAILKFGWKDAIVRLLGDRFDSHVVDRFLTKSIYEKRSGPAEFEAFDCSECNQFKSDTWEFLLDGEKEPRRICDQCVYTLVGKK